MKKKIYLALLPIVLCVLGIIYFQVDWVYKTYQLEAQKTSVAVNEALNATLKRYHKRQQNTLDVLIRPKLQHLSDSLNIRISENLDSLILQFKNAKKPKDAETQFGSLGYTDGRAFIKLPEHEVNKTNWGKGNNDDEIMKIITSIFREDEKGEPVFLKKDSIEISRLLHAEFNKRQLTTLIGGCKLLFFKGDSIPDQKTAIAANMPVRQYLPSSTKAFKGPRSWVAFSFNQEQQQVLSQMIFRSGLSLVLILIMICSFIYLIRLLFKQKRLAKIKDDFIDNLTHEFKTPIATISVAIEGMQKFNALQEKDKTVRYLEIARTELTRLNDMVTKILNISAYDKNTLQVTRHRVDLTALLTEIIELEHFRAVKQVEFVVNLDESIQYLEADPMHFKNALINLIDNSVKYARENVVIKITGGKQNNFAVLKIEDNGIGIEKDSLKAIFDKFYRIPNNLTPIKGNGLGLSYVKSVIERHGGSITIESEINKGSIFTISLPLS